MFHIMKLLLLIFWVLLSNVAYAESLPEQLNQMVEQLQKSPNDIALREQIIKLAQKLKPVPVIPEEARRHFVKAVTLQKEAKNSEDYDLPIQEYQQALLLAPWWSDAYYDLSSAFELKQQYVEGIQNLKLSILASPEGPDARAAQDKVYALEAKAEKNAQAQSVVAAAREKAQEAHFEGTWILTGGTYIISRNSSGNYILSSDDSSSNKHNFASIIVNGRKIAFTEEFQMADGRDKQRLIYNLTLSDDGEKLVGNVLVYDYETTSNIACAGTRKH